MNTHVDAVAVKPVGFLLFFFFNPLFLWLYSLNLREMPSLTLEEAEGLDWGNNFSWPLLITL